MEAAVLLYPGCIFFEVALAMETLAPHLHLRIVTPEGKPHRASNGAVMAADGDLAMLEADVVQAVLIPGGDPWSLLRPTLAPGPALRRQAEAGAIVAGICAGNLVMAASGLLRGRRGTHNYTPEYAPPENVAATAAFWSGMQFERANVVEDGNLITAQPWAYRQYAAALGRRLGVLTEAEASGLENYVAKRSYRGP